MTAKTTRKEFLNQLMTEPERVVSQLNLVYVDDKKLCISRLRDGDEFVYKLKNKPVKDKRQLERIENLVIPPAWEKVRITHLPSGHLQAVGRDDKNRKQYKYHANWVKIRNQTKFYKMAQFGQHLPKIRKQVDSDLDQKGWPSSKVVALVVRLMEETHIRIGNVQYAKRNKSYGLSTLRKRHVNLHKNKLKFEFVGKKGKKHSVTVRNKKLIRLVSRCEEIPGWELFQYYDSEGNKQQLDSSMVNEYLHAVSGQFFTAKDFRTWAASVVFFDTLIDLGYEPNPEKNHKNILLGFDNAAAALGNTRNVCRKYYVHPYLVSKYEDGSIKKYFSLIANDTSTAAYFTPTERAMLKIMESYRPKL
ncbi:DNA topoisomerase IB [uncultured Kriegella sp.]|uniref:DNA topoisomerase IB n=1 Tax=uncultured Kriegella sp. TaxID=1798910 RepID=UPI0030DDD2C0|tara:strand:+ start:99131 stop:100213 length:1083 start_codon:yes stop_codon:yes gene_type:complete